MPNFILTENVFPTSVLKMISGKVSEEHRYYLNSLTDIHAFAHAARNHWSIGSQIHWQLDATFREDTFRTRQNNSPRNRNILRKEALRLLNNTNFGKRVSIRRKLSHVVMNHSALNRIFPQK